MAELFLCNCPPMDATGLYWRYVNIGSGNGLVPLGNKPLPEPMLSQINVAICVTRPQWIFKDVNIDVHRSLFFSVLWINHVTYNIIDQFNHHGGITRPAFVSSTLPYSLTELNYVHDNVIVNQSACMLGVKIFPLLGLISDVFLLLSQLSRLQLTRSR